MTPHRIVMTLVVLLLASQLTRSRIALVFAALLAIAAFATVATSGTGGLA
jgi:hypothetical protein